jgi:hypothetical protein
MPSRRRSLAISVVGAAAIVAACGGGATPAPSGGVGASPGASGAAPSVALPSVALPSGAIPSGAIPSISGGEDGGEFQVVLEGGSNAGTHGAPSAEGGCVTNAGNMSLTLGGSDAATDPEAVTISLSGPLAGASGASFTVQIQFGAAAYIVAYPIGGNADGALTVDDGGNSIEVSAEGTGQAFSPTAPGGAESVGFRIQATCRTVVRS